MQHQMQSIAQLDETDRQIREEKMSSEYVKRLKEARTLYREDLIDCVRQCTWYVLSPSRNSPFVFVVIDDTLLGLHVINFSASNHAFALQVPCDNVCKVEA